MHFIEAYLSGIGQIAAVIDKTKIRRTIDLIHSVKKKGGRMFIVGVGGGAGHASHAVNDFRKIVEMEAYSPTDNVSELTARINDEGWDSCYAMWLKASKMTADDMLFVFSVGGGSTKYGLSVNIVEALRFAKSVGAAVAGIVGKDGGETAKHADACILIPDVDSKMSTAYTESLQAVIWHLIVSHPELYSASMKWEAITDHQSGE